MLLTDLMLAAALVAAGGVIALYATRPRRGDR
jgi:hypothetical protein